MNLLSVIILFKENAEILNLPVITYFAIFHAKIEKTICE